MNGSARGLFQNNKDGEHKWHIIGKCKLIGQRTRVPKDEHDQSDHLILTKGRQGLLGLRDLGPLWTHGPWVFILSKDMFSGNMSRVVF